MVVGLCLSVDGRWSLVVGLWSLVFGLWSLLFGLGPWSLVFGPLSSVRFVSWSSGVLIVCSFARLLFLSFGLWAVWCFGFLVF